MAREAKKDPNELTVEQKLKTLFQLQTMLSKIDEIKTLRGELPLEVQDLEDEIAGLSTRIDKIKAEVDELKSAIAGKRVEIETAKASVEKYKSQQDNVRNNREYDFLTKEIEFQTLEIELCEKRIKEYSADKEEKEAEVTKNDYFLTRADIQLSLGRNLVKATTTCVTLHIHNTQSVTRVLADSFERLQQTWFNLSFQVFSFVSQFLFFLFGFRDNFIQFALFLLQVFHSFVKNLIVCEYCGRIMIDPELAGVQIEHKVEEAPVATTKRAIRRKTAE